MATRSIVALGLGAALALSACSTDRELTEPDPEPVTEERLTAALIDEGDLPEGYVAADESTPFASEVLPEHECDDRLAELEPEESVSRDFTRDAVAVTHALAWFPGGGGAVEQLFRDVANDCSSVVVADQGLAIRTGGLDFGVLSDDTLAIRIELDPDSGAIEERDIVLMRKGDLVSLIRMSGPRPSDKALLDGAARVAIGYLGLLHDDTT
ncbi:MAG: hypothetical protein ACLGI8_12510 [Acidimicrobiia bacterium]